MTNFDWAKLGVKLIGLWLMISALTAMTSDIVYFFQSRGGLYYLSVLNPLAAGLIGFYLWSRSDRLASSIFPTVSTVERFGGGGQEHLLAPALSVIGIWLVSEALPNLAYNVALFISGRLSVYRSVFGPVPDPSTINVRAEANILAALLRAFIGIGLFFGSKRLVELIAIMRGRRS